MVYNLSKDYELLLECLKQGLQAACFVDKKFHPYKEGDKVYRDIARIRRKEAWDMDIAARGVSYGGLSKWHKDDTNYNPKKYNELEAFKIECERLNLEWIMP